VSAYRETTFQTPFAAHFSRSSTPSRRPNRHLVEIYTGYAKSTLKGDGAQDWVIQKYTYYYNLSGQLLWRTDDIPLLGVHAGQREAIHANVFTNGGSYPWTGWNSDCTTRPDDTNGGTCGGWTNVPATEWASFAFPDLTFAANEACGGISFILCAQQ
jgi:hypothetical protein